MLDLYQKVKEKKRIIALNSYNILDTEDEKEFDSLTKLATIICEVPVAAISLIDETRQWFKSKIGLTISQTNRDISFCQYTINGDHVFEVEDATKDDRFKNNPLVTGKPEIRFYAGYPLVDPDGHTLGTICVIDHKAKKLTMPQHRALSILAQEVVSHIVSRKERFERKQFEELFINSIDMVCIADTNGMFKKVNPAFTKVLGWSGKELTERPFVDFLHPDDKEKTLREIETLSMGVRSINFINRYLTKSGEYKTLSWVANPDLASGIIYAIARDKTEYFKSQENLLLAEKKFRDVFENSPDAIFVEDSSGKILDVNAAAASLQGLPKEKMIGNHIRHMVPEEKYVKVLSDYKKLFLGAIRIIESVVWSETKGEIPVEISGKKIKYGNQTALLLNVRDISERKKMEARLKQAMIDESRQREELIKRSVIIQEEERNRIAAEMHDEVGSDLSRISILGQIIKKGFNDSSVVSGNIEKVLTSAKNIQVNISEIIWSMDTKNNTLENLLAFVHYFSTEYMESGSIDFKIQLPGEIPVVIVDGKTRRNIFLIIKESLNNIVKYSGATNASINIGFSNNLLTALIIDNGNGFDPANIKRFSNGIKNMKQRANSCGGNLKIDSRKKKGTKVFLQIPLSVPL